MRASRTHQSLLWLFSQDPDLGAELGCRVAGRPPPTDTLTIARQGVLQRSRLDGNEDDIVAADLVLTVHRRLTPYAKAIELEPIRALWIIEVQLGRDPTRAQAWSRYFGAVIDRYGLDADRVEILIICPYAPVRRWLESKLLPRMKARPLLARPEHVERITNFAQARARPEAAVLAAVYHGHRLDAEYVVAAALYSLGAVERPESHDRYQYLIQNSAHPDMDIPQVVFGPVPEDIAFAWEMQGLTWAQHGERFAAHGRQEGLAQGRAESLAAQLDARRADFLLMCELLDLEPSPAQRAEIEACTSPETIGRWMRALRDTQNLTTALATTD